jgi:hypothetical protein
MVQLLDAVAFMHEKWVINQTNGPLCPCTNT